MWWSKRKRVAGRSGCGRALFGLAADASGDLAGEVERVTDLVTGQVEMQAESADKRGVERGLGRAFDDSQHVRAVSASGEADGEERQQRESLPALVRVGEEGFEFGEESVGWPRGGIHDVCKWMQERCQPELRGESARERAMLGGPKAG